MRAICPWVLLGCALALAGCNLASIGPKTQYYQAAWIFASWSAGRTGTPLDEKSQAPVNFPGSLCPPNSIVLENWASDTQGAVRATNTCTITVSVAYCVASGSGSPIPAGSTLQVCAQDPLKTPLLSLSFMTILPGTREVLGITGKNLALDVFYCSDQSNLVDNPIRCETL